MSILFYIYAISAVVVGVGFLIENLLTGDIAHDVTTGGDAKFVIALIPVVNTLYGLAMIFIGTNVAFYHFKKAWKKARKAIK